MFALFHYSQQTSLLWQQCVNIRQMPKQLMINPCSFFHYWQWLSFGVPPPVAQKQQLVPLLIFLTPPSELFSAVQFTEDFSHQSSPKPYFLPNCQVPVSPGKGMVVTSFCANLCEIFFFPPPGSAYVCYFFPIRFTQEQFPAPKQLFHHWEKRKQTHFPVHFLKWSSCQALFLICCGT